MKLLAPLQAKRPDASQTTRAAPGEPVDERSTPGDEKMPLPGTRIGGGGAGERAARDEEDALTLRRSRTPR